MDRKTLIAVGLSVAVIIISLIIQTKFFPVPSQQALSNNYVDNTVITETQKTEVYKVQEEESTVKVSSSEKNEIVTEIVRETNLLKIKFSKTGGEITSLLLKEHLDVMGNPVQLIIKPNEHKFFSIAFGQFNTKPVDADFEFTDLGNNRWQFSTELVSPDSVPFLLTKTYTFPPNSYLFELEVEIENSENELPSLDFNGISYTLGVSPQIGPAYETLDGRNEYRNFRYLTDGKAKNLRLRRKEVVSETTRVRWTSIVGKYFALIVVPDAQLYTITYDNRKDLELTNRSSLFLSRPPINSSRNIDKFRFYIGPLKREILTRYNDPMNDPFKIGNYQFELAARSNPIIGWLANILRFFLDSFYKLIPNYGVSIILLTILIKILFFPLTQKSFESTSKMSALGPKIEDIKKKHQGKPEKLNQEMMSLYKKEGVNPLGGCLPLLLQMPIFFALFELLNNAFDLRGAVFISPWIADLSAPEKFLSLGFTLPLLNWDELRILPFVMLGTTLFQSKISQSPSINQGQMKLMMYGMPIFFFFILYNMASGLVIYWTMQNVLSIFQQLYINQKRKKKKI